MGRSEDISIVSAKMHRTAAESRQRHNILAEDCDYDQLSPVGAKPGHVTSVAVPYACTSFMDRERKKSPKHSLAIVDTETAAQQKPSASSVPNTPLFALRKAFNRSSSSGKHCCCNYSYVVTDLFDETQQIDGANLHYCPFKFSIWQLG